MATAETLPHTVPVDCLHHVHILVGVQLGGFTQAVGGMSMGLLTFQVQPHRTSDLGVCCALGNGCSPGREACY